VKASGAISQIGGRQNSEKCCDKNSIGTIYAKKIVKKRKISVESSETKVDIIKIKINLKV